MKISISEELKGIVRLGVSRLSIPGRNVPDDAALWCEIEDFISEIRNEFDGFAPSAIPGVEEARKLYRAVGLDPTKTRPSSEALMRRVTKGKGLFRIHPLVDMFNLVSLANLLPVGLYDESKIIGNAAMVRLGEVGWGFDGIRKDRVNVQGRLCVCDESGPFGSPTSDSLRTSIEGPVEHALAIFFQHADGDLDRLENALDLSSSLAHKHLDAVVSERYIL